MHRLLKRQLKKAGIDPGEACTTPEMLKRLLAYVDQSYLDADDDRNLLEHSLEVSSKEMQELYATIKEHAAQALRKSEAKYTRLIENLKQHYFFYTQEVDGTFKYVSDSVTDVLGYTKEAFLHADASLYVDVRTEMLVRKKRERVHRGEMPKPYNVGFRHKNGSVRMLEVLEQPVFDAQGNVTEIEGIARDITQIVKTQKELNFLARHDPLTGISNRASLFSQMEHLLASAKREHKTFALLFFDLDHFKHINDALGHVIGDKLLKEVVERIRPNIREEDIFARLGGDEFVIVLEGVKRSGLTKVVNKIMEMLHREFHIGGYDFRISASIGVTLYPEDGTDAQTLVKNADIAMYKAKRNGRDGIYFFTEALNREMQEEMTMQLEMAKGFEAGEFELYYQPIVTTGEERLVGAEALLRWHHDGRIIYPEAFISLAENSGFIIRLGRWIIEEGCRAIAAFNRIGGPDFHLSVNLSTYQLQHDDVARLIKAAVAKAGIDPKQLFIEITESVFIKKAVSTLEVLKAVQAMGVHICLDDFGTGYSSLSYLHRYPVDVIKIDKSFVDLITQEGEPAVLLDTIIAMGKTLGLEVIAEGVETEYQRAYLLKKACDYYQGHLFSKALPEAAFAALLKSVPATPKRQ